MITKKKIYYIFFIIIILLLTIYKYNHNETEKKLIELSSDKIAEINIIDQYNNMEKLYEDPEAEKYVLVDIFINGEYFKDVGIRTKGSTIYNVIRKSSNPKEHSFKIKLDYVDENQNYNGINEFYLNTGVPDKSRIREYIVYEAYNDMGIATQKYCFTEVSINNISNGLFTMVEVINTRYVRSKYNSSNGNLYKPENIIQENVIGSDLIFRSNNPKTYKAIFNNTKTDNTRDEDKVRLVSILKKLKNNEDIEDSFVDFDKIIKIMAVNTVLENLDNFYGATRRNFYLYEENGKLDIIPFDFNMSLGRNGNHSAFPPDEVDDIDIFNDNITSIFIEIIKDNSDLLDKYYNYIFETIKMLESENYVEKVDEIDNKVSSIVEGDKNYIYTFDEYKLEVESIKNFITYRVDYIKNELDY